MRATTTVVVTYGMVVCVLVSPTITDESIEMSFGEAHVGPTNNVLDEVHTGATLRIQ